MVCVFRIRCLGLFFSKMYASERIYTSVQLLVLMFADLSEPHNLEGCRYLPRLGPWLACEVGTEDVLIFPSSLILTSSQHSFLESES
jgi:hypothetical protein